MADPHDLQITFDIFLESFEVKLNMDETFIDPNGDLDRTWAPSRRPSPDDASEAVETVNLDSNLDRTWLPILKKVHVH